jgi:hypothetical protein
LEAKETLISRLETDLESQTNGFNAASNRPIRSKYIPSNRTEQAVKFSNANEYKAQDCSKDFLETDDSYSLTSSLELSELLGVDMEMSNQPNKLNKSTVSSDRLNEITHLKQMVNILQAQRDRYKEKLDLVRITIIIIAPRSDHSLFSAGIIFE